MIIDKVEHFQDYYFGSAWRAAFEFLSTLTPEAEDRKYPIQGDDIYAVVMSYTTFSPEMALFEAHREYVDIQTVLVGAEGFECAFCDELCIDTPYDTRADIAFYKRDLPGITRVDVYPGTFVMLYPHDAHMPGLIIGNEEKVIKKVVIKIKKELIMQKTGDAPYDHE
jgi:YhcH/YjgK/YiaL family protein